MIPTNAIKGLTVSFVQISKPRASPARPDANKQEALSQYRKRVRMRGFPFGAFSSFNSPTFGSMTVPSAEREAPHANSLSAIGFCSSEDSE